MKKNNITKCPICNVIVVKIHQDGSSDKFFFSIIMILIFPLYFYYICNMVHGIIGNVVFYSSTSKYCDNHYKMCEYFNVNGILVSNVISEKYDNFNVKYYLSSSYNWTTINNISGICNDLETHTYDSYETSLMIKEKVLVK